MKKIISLFCLSFIIISCSSNKEESIVNESTKIINGYADTLEWSIQDSRDVKNLIETNQNKLLQDINSIK